MQPQSIALPISRTTEYGFAFVEPIPLDDRFQHTPMWENAPRAPVMLDETGAIPRWRVVRCPYCYDEHWHSAGKGEDPRRFLGGRVSHCLPTVPEDPRRLGEYRLIAIVGDPTEQGLDRYFPMWWDIGEPPRQQVHGRVAFSARLKRSVWRKSGGYCWYCGCELDPFTDFEVDHFLSLKNGGTNKLDNLVPSCKSCNSQKSHWHVEVFRTRHHPRERFWFERDGKSQVAS